MGQCDKVFLNPGVESFSSTILRFKCRLYGKTVIGWNS